LTSTHVSAFQQQTAIETFSDHAQIKSEGRRTPELWGSIARVLDEGHITTTLPWHSRSFQIAAGRKQKTPEGKGTWTSACPEFTCCPCADFGRPTV